MTLVTSAVILAVVGALAAWIPRGARPASRPAQADHSGAGRHGQQLPGVFGIE
jgi:hypothetical protein